MTPFMLDASYTLLVYSTYTLVRCFTAATICGMNREVTGAHIILSLSPDTGTGSHYLDRTLVGFLAQHPFKRASQHLTLLHTCDLALHWSQPDAPTRAHALLPHGQQALYLLIIFMHHRNS